MIKQIADMLTGECKGVDTRTPYERTRFDNNAFWCVMREDDRYMYSSSLAVDKAHARKKYMGIWGEPYTYKAWRKIRDDEGLKVVRVKIVEVV